MSNYTLGVKVIGNAKSYEDTMERVQNKLSSVQSNLNKVGLKLTNCITKPAGLAAAALGGVTLGKGFSRLVAIDDARAKLEGLGHSGKEVEVIMNSALASVKGTAFGLGEAATTAASAIASGIQPGKDLTKYLTTVADAAAIAGVDMASMGSIFNKVAAKGRVDAEILNQLSDAGVPALQMLAKELGVTTAEVSEMVSAGEVGFDTFLKAMESGVNGAAKIMGQKSFSGALANIGASISRIGANFLDAGGRGGGFFSQLKPLMAEFTESLGKAEDKATELGVKFGAAFADTVDKVRSLKAGFDGLPEILQSLITHTAGFGAAFLIGIGPVITGVSKAKAGFTTLKGAVSEVQVGINGAKAVISGFGSGLKGTGMVLDGTSEKARQLGLKIGGLKKYFQSSTEAANSTRNALYGTSRAGTATTGSLYGTSTATFSLKTALLNMKTGAIAAGTSVKASALGMKASLMGVATSAWAAVAPFLPLIAVLGLLAAAFAYAWQTDEQFKNSIIDCGSQIMAAFAPVLSQLAGIITTIATALAPVISQLLSSLMPAILAIVEALTPIITQMAPVIVTILGAISTAIQALAPVITTILTIVAKVIQTIIQIITPIIVFIGNVLTAIIERISAFVNIVIEKFSAAKDFISNVWNTIKTIASAVWSFISSHVVAKVDQIKAAVTAAGNIIKAIWNSIKSVASTVWNGISSLVSKVIGAIIGAAGRVASPFITAFRAIGNAFSSLFGKISGIANKIKNVFSGIGSKLKAVIPFLAHGTNNWAGGFAYMNEGGRGELVHLPNGSQVIPHDISVKYAKEAARVNGMQAGGVSQIDYDKLADVMINAFSGIVIENTTNIDGKKAASAVFPFIDKAFGRKGALAEKGVY